MYGWMWFSVSTCFKQALVVSSLIHSFCRCTPSTATLTVAVTHSVLAVRNNLQLCHITAESPSEPRRANAWWLSMEWKPRLPSNFPLNSSASRSKRRQWVHTIRRDVSKHFKPGRWTKICLLHFKPKDFYNYWSSYRTLREDAIPSTFPFNNESWSEAARSSSRTRSRCHGRPRPHYQSPLLSC